MKLHPGTMAEYQQLIAVARGQQPATLWFKDVRFLNVYTGQIDQGQVYVAGRRVAYVGDALLPIAPSTQVVSLAAEQILVPGYIEPHAHPCQIYNPLTWGETALQSGTVASVNDSLTLLMLLGPAALNVITQLDARGRHLWLWWCSFDGGPTPLARDAEAMRAWFTHPLVVQGGEFTHWPSFVQGDLDLTRALFAIKRDFRQRVEGHLPGASAETLNVLTAAGISADHEALDGADIIKRLRIGLYATLRYSSIRPDLPQILAQIAQHPGLNLARLMLTSDGPAPFFVDQSSCASMIKQVMQAGLPAIAAYRMATLNPATYYGLDEDLGGLAPGRLACFNVLNQLDEPQPLHVLQEGIWVRYNGVPLPSANEADTAQWLQHSLPPLRLNATIDPEAIRPNTPIGIELRNDVITRSYTCDPGHTLHDDECWLSLLDPQGQGRVHTRLKRFCPGLLGLASTFSASTDVLLIGRDPAAMALALHEALASGGGIVALFASGERFALPLPLRGIMSLAPMEQLHAATAALTAQMRAHGYPFGDPVYTLLFLTATHLPSVRISREGMYLVKENRVLPPTVAPAELD